MILDAQARPFLLEVNANPSLGIDSVFPTEGPAAVAMAQAHAAASGPDAVHLPDIGASRSDSAGGTRGDACQGQDTDWRQMVHAARPFVCKMRRNACRCNSHHRPHVHEPCAVDLVTKFKAVGGALTIVQRERRARKERGRAAAAEEAAGEAAAGARAAGAEQAADDGLVEGTAYEVLRWEEGGDGGGAEPEPAA